jgi:uncharacterized protein (TIGR03435 family)
VSLRIPVLIVACAVLSGTGYAKSGTLHAQAGAGSNPPTGLLDSDPQGVAHAAEPSAKPLAFDVVSVRLHKPAADHASIQSPQNGDGITIESLDLEDIIDYAYSFERPNMVTGMPVWTQRENYDIVAKVADADVAAFRKLNQADRKLMLQALLADKFQLKAHRAPREIPVYALVVDKNGPKMKHAAPGDTYANGPKYPNGRLAGAGTITPTGMGGMTGQAAEMAALAVMLSRLGLGREVVDRTGLTGRYDFTLRFAPEVGSIPVINGQAAGVPAEDAALPSIFTAVQEQLGLRLESTKGTVEGLMIDHVERPSEN